MAAGDDVGAPGFAERVWARHRRHFPWALFVLAWTFGLVMFVGPGMVVVCVYQQTTASESASLSAGVLAVYTAGLACAVASAVGTRRAIRAWGRGDTSDPVGAGAAAMRVTTTMTVRGGLLNIAMFLLFVLPLVDRYVDLSGLGWVACGLFVCLYVAAAMVVFALGFHLLMGPMLREVDQHLADSPTVARAWSVRARLVVGVAAACWLAGMSGGAAAISWDSRDGRIMGAVIGSLAVALYMAFLFNLGLVRPTLDPLTDLEGATQRIRRGDTATRVPVTSSDELGELAQAFNEMQRGLREREALHAAFGSYVDPTLAQRLIESGSSMFDGEDLVVTVLFADVRDFTSYSEAVGPAAAVQLLNRLFDVIVPILHEHGGHANHYLGDGLLAVFGAPNPLARHADAAVAAAIEIRQQVRAELGEQLRLGIGVNTGPVIAGTVGGGGRHEFTVIGDTVNVAARVEQLTKETGDDILITDATRSALSTPRPRSAKRGSFDLRGKSTAVAIHALGSAHRADGRRR